MRSNLMDAIGEDTLELYGVTTMELPWWEHLGMGWVDETSPFFMDMEVD